MATITGTNGNDTLPRAGENNSGDDTFYGLSGADTITGGAGKDLMYGGAGADTFVIDDPSEVVSGERYSGGDGIDTIRIDLDADLRAAVIDADVEILDGYRSTSLTTAQFARFQTVSGFEMFLSGGGSVNMAGRTVSVGVVYLLDPTSFSLAGQNTRTNIFGSDGNDTIYGDDGGTFALQTYLSGGGGNDTITGGTGSDILVGGAGKDVLNGGAGDDVLQIESQSEIVAGESYRGGIGQDALRVSFNADLRSVSVGSDVEVLDAEGTTVKLTAAQLGNFQTINADQVQLTSSGTADLTDADLNVESLFGYEIVLSTAGNTLILTGVSTGVGVLATGGTNSVYGSDGDDYLVGATGADTFHGGDGDDVMSGGRGKDTFDGGAGDDSLVLYLSDFVAGESYTGGTGFDTLALGTVGAFNLSSLIIDADIEELAGSAATVITLTAAQLDHFSSILAGGPLTLSGAGTANLAGARLEYNQTFNLSAAGNTLSLAGVLAHTADATFFKVFGGASADIITGSDGRDLLEGAGGDDKISAGAGSDSLYGGAGKDALNGGEGIDRFTFASSSEVAAGESYIGGSGFDYLEINAPGTFNFSAATIGADVEGLFGETSTVLLTAAQLDGFKVIGGIGTITLTTAGTASLAGVTIDPFVTFNLAAAGNTLNLGGSISSDLRQPTHFTVKGGNGNDVITGGDGNGESAVGSGVADDTLNGGGGNDSIKGGGGNDFITGGTGKDLMYGGANNDTLIVKSQAEIVAGEQYYGDAGRDALSIQTTAAVNLSSTTISQIEELQSPGKVSLTAAQLGAFSFVDTGDVTLTGSGTADLTNAEIYTNTFNLNAAGNFLNLTGVNSQGFRINGGAGTDTIYGGDIGDLIIGGGGNDVLKGGGGPDGFYFPTVVGAGIDRILDFSGTTAFDGSGPGEGDLIDLVGEVGTFSYNGAAAFTNTGHSQARFAGNGVVQVDINGNGVSDLSFVLVGMTNANQLQMNDFAFS